MQLLFKERSFSSSSLYLSYVGFIIQLLLSKELFHQSRSYLSNVYFRHPASNLQRTILSIQVLFKQRFFSSYSLYLSYVVFIVQLLLCKELFHHPRFYLTNVHFHHTASTLQRTISSIHVLFKQRSFSPSIFYFAKNFFINPGST